jgi:hypothetical protein
VLVCTFDIADSSYAFLDVTMVVADFLSDELLGSKAL